MKVCKLCVVVLLLFVKRGYSINAANPCDPLQTNIVVSDAYNTEEIQTLLHFEPLPWMMAPLKLVNCSKRGLRTVPTKHIFKGVEILDLSYNSILYVNQDDFSGLDKLIVLWMPFNCPRNSDLRLPLCRSHLNLTSSLQYLSNLRLLNLANNILLDFPQRLPSSLNFIDVSQTAIQPIRKDDVGNLLNLIAFVARDVCIKTSAAVCTSQFKLEPGAFENSNGSLKLLSLAGSHMRDTIVADLTYPSLIALNAAKTFVSVKKPFTFENSPRLRYLSLQNLHPDTTTHVIIFNNTFNALIELEFLDLSNNFIDRLPDDVFEFNQNLTYLDLTGNCLRKSKSVQNPNFFQHFKNLKHVFLGFNHCPYDFTNVKELNHPRENVLLNLSTGFSQLVNLETLSFGIPPLGLDKSIDFVSKDLNFNTIYNQSLRALQNLTRLRSLAFAYCNVREIDFKVFSSLSQVRNIDISNNHLDDLILTSNSQAFQSNLQIEYNHRLNKKLLSMVSVVRYQNIQQHLEHFCNFEKKIDVSANALKLLHQQQFPSSFSKSLFTSLDLSFNQIESVRDNTFRFLPLLCWINLQNNPINYFHKHAFSRLNNLEYLLLNNTQVYHHYSAALHFLENVDSSYKLWWGAGKFFDNFNPMGENTLRMPNITSVDFSYNAVPSPELLHKAFLSFPNVISITLRSCRLFSSKFFLPNKFVAILDMSENEFITLPGSLKNMSKLTTINFSQNKITYLDLNLSIVTPNLEYLDLSFNRINYVGADVFRPPPQYLKRLYLQNNYLTQTSLNAFSFDMLNQLLHFDIRRNSFVCGCQLTKTFGDWVTNSPFFLENRPGFLPVCSQTLDDYFEGCVTCEKQDDSHSLISLLTYCSNKSCQAYPLMIYCLSFTCTFLVFLVTAITFKHREWKLWLAKRVMKEVISFDRGAECTSSRKPTVFVYHALVCYDLEDEKVGNWVDQHLIPNLGTSCRIALKGKHDQCGMSPVHQLLQNMEASRKVLVIMTKNYAKSNEGSYICSSLEYMKYRFGSDCVLILTFESDPLVGGYLQQRQKNRPWTVLTIMDDTSKWPILWITLKTMINSSAL